MNKEQFADVQVNLEVVLAKKYIKFKELLNLDIGYLIFFNEEANNNLQLYCNQQYISDCELIVVNNKYQIIIDNNIKNMNLILD